MIQSTIFFFFFFLFDDSFCRNDGLMFPSVSEVSVEESTNLSEPSIIHEVSLRKGSKSTPEMR